jgi:hypothetical protein
LRCGGDGGGELPLQDGIPGGVDRQRAGGLDERPLAKLTTGRVELAAVDGALALDFVLQVDDRLDQLLGPGRAAGHVHVDRDEAVDTLHDGVGVEHAPRAGAGAHRDAPLGLVHLLPDPLQHR